MIPEQKSNPAADPFAVFLIGVAKRLRQHTFFKRDNERLYEEEKHDWPDKRKHIGKHHCRSRGNQKKAQIDGIAAHAIRAGGDKGGRLAAGVKGRFVFLKKLYRPDKKCDASDYE